MDYNDFIGKRVAVSYRPPYYLDIKRWRESGYKTSTVCGKVLTGTLGIIVIEDEDTKLTYRINDELIVLFQEMEDNME